MRRNYRNLTESDAGSRNLYNNATELHAGAEYRAAGLALRAGWWRDPARFSTSVFDPSIGLGQRQDHLTFGAGIDAGRARIDFAIDDADMPSLRRASVGITFGGPGSRGR